MLAGFFSCYPAGSDLLLSPTRISVGSGIRKGCGSACLEQVLKPCAINPIALAGGCFQGFAVNDP